MKFDTKIWHPNISSQALALNKCLDSHLRSGTELVASARLGFKDFVSRLSKSA